MWYALGKCVSVYVIYCVKFSYGI